MSRLDRSAWPLVAVIGLSWQPKPPKPAAFWGHEHP